MKEQEDPRRTRLPRSCPREARVQIPPERLQEARRLYGEARYCDALETVAEFGSLQNWAGGEERVFASRLAQNLGAPRLSDYLILSTWREQPEVPDVRLFMLYHRIGVDGPLAGWELAESLEETGFTGKLLAHWLAAKGHLLAMLRDFDQAELLLRRAFEAGEESDPWLWVEYAEIMELGDRREEALDAARYALELRPFYRPAVRSAATLYHHLHRDEEVRDLLVAACEQTQSFALAVQWAGVCSERDDHREALYYYRLARAMTPLLEPSMRRWFAGREFHHLYGLECFDEAAEAAREAGWEEQEAMMRKLRAGEATMRRVRLPIPFVQQDHHTCGPASLASICAYWQRAIPQEEIVESICYDGTLDHAERWWAEQTGLLVREFRVTFEAARDLIEAGIPFTLTTREIDHGHLQVVMGYDACRESLLIREPGWRHFREFSWKEFAENYAATGPRGMLLADESKAAILESLALPDAEFYDRLYRVNRALHEHQRAGAEAELALMQEEAPEHLLTLFAERALAEYDRNLPAILQVVEKLQARFPDDPRLIDARLRILSAMGEPQALMALLEELESGEKAHPVFWCQLARHLSADAREHARVRRLLRRAARYLRAKPDIWQSLGDLLWLEGEREWAVRYLRIAACLGGKQIGLQLRYFGAAQVAGAQEEALALLQTSYQQDAHRDAAPTIGLYQALSRLDRTPEALALLEDSLTHRPEDGELLLFAAERMEEVGQRRRATELLEQARPHAAEIDWLETAARLARRAGDSTQEAAYLDAWLERSPLALDAHAALAAIHARREGLSAATRYLQQIAAVWPNHFGIQELAYGACAEESNWEAATDQLARLLEIHPTNAWARREMALCLLRRGYRKQALEVMTEAFPLAPNHPNSSMVLANILERCGRHEEAREYYQYTIQIDVNQSAAIYRLLELCHGTSMRRVNLAFVHRELLRQATLDEGLSAYCAVAFQELEPEVLLEQIETLLAERPDVWHVWEAKIQQLGGMDRPREALATAEEICRRFPLVPGSWRLRGEVCRQQGAWDEAAKAFRRALELNPEWTMVARDLVAVLGEAGRFDEAEVTLADALQRQPNEASNHGYHAQFLWQRERRDEALAAIQRAIRLLPGYDWAWEQFTSWSAMMGAGDQVLAFARQMTEERPGLASVWLHLAALLDRPEQFPECLAAIDRAIALQPHAIEPHDRKASALAVAGRFEEARQAATGHDWGGELPMRLQGRAIWVLACQGKLEEAKEGFAKLLEEHPHYEWGWHQLYRISINLRDLDGALQAAGQLERLAPREVDGYLCSSEVHRRARRLDEAIAALHRAHLVDPWDRRVTLELFDTLLCDDRHEEAWKVLWTLECGFEGAVAIAARMRLLIRQGRVGAAFDLAPSLFAAPDLEPDMLLAVRAHFAMEDRGRHFDALTRRATRHKKGAGAVLTHFARMEIRHGRRLPLRALWRWHRVGRDLRGALEIELDRMSREPRPSLARARWIRRRFRPLLEDQRLWGSFGMVLEEAGAAAETVAWLGDWAQRSHLEGWMLANLENAYLRRGQFDEAVHLANWVLANLAVDQSWGWHRNVMAIEAAVRGDAEEVDRQLEGRSWRSGDEIGAFLFQLAAGWRKVHDKPIPERERLLKQLKKKTDPLLRRVTGERRGLRRLRQHWLEQWKRAPKPFMEEAPIEEAVSSRSANGVR